MSAHDSSVEIRDALQRFEQGLLEPATFDHASHVRMAYAMSAHYSFDEALARFARGLRALSERAGTPEKYHMTITVAFLSLVAQRRIETNAPHWNGFIAANSDLLDRRCLNSWYARGELDNPVAREIFVLPRRTLRCTEPE